MSANEISIHGGVVRVTEASVMANSRFNRIKADNSQPRNLSVHFITEGETAPGPREALLVSVLSGLPARWLQNAMHATDGNETMRINEADINFEAVSAEPRTTPPEADGMVDVFHMSTVQRDGMTRLHLAMTNQSQSELHGAVLMSKGQVTQMIANLLVLYSRLNED